MRNVETVSGVWLQRMLRDNPRVTVRSYLSSSPSDWPDRHDTSLWLADNVDTYLMMSQKVGYQFTPIRSRRTGDWGDDLQAYSGECRHLFVCFKGGKDTTPARESFNKFTHNPLFFFPQSWNHAITIEYRYIVRYIKTLSSFLLFNCFKINDKTFRE